MKKKLMIFALLAALLYLFFELPNIVKLIIYTAAPFVLLAFAYILEKRAQRLKTKSARAKLINKFINDILNNETPQIYV